MMYLTKNAEFVMLAAAASTNINEIFQVLKPETILPIECNVNFQERMEALTGFLLSGRSKEEIIEAHHRIETDTVEPNSWQNHYLTGLIFCKAFEERVSVTYPRPMVA